MSPIFGSRKQAQVVHRQVRARTLSIIIPGREPVSFSPVFLIFVFLTLVIIGMVLLYLPISSADGQSASIIDSLFTSVSAVCVTGLIVVDTGTHWSLFGQIIILLLIQIGGFGIMTGTTLILLLFGRKVGLNEKMLAGETLGLNKVGEVLKLVKKMGLFVLIAEGVGALIFFIHFYIQNQSVESLWHAVFHSISAFNNAGFDIFGNFRSLQDYQNDVLVVLVTAVLVIGGGISFVVLNEISVRRVLKKLSLDSKIVLITTLSLLLLGMAVTIITEFSDRSAYEQLPLGTKLLTAFFHSVTSRTAGFSTIEIARMAPFLLFFTMFLMFIGGATGSTAGGIKVNTFDCLIATVWSSIRGQGHAGAYGREFTRSQIQRVLAVVTLSFGLISFIVLCLTLTEKMDFLSLLFETVSAFGTVGLSTGITPQLSVAGKLLISATMFIGRLGTVYLAVSLVQREIPSTHRYPRETVRIG